VRAGSFIILYHPSVPKEDLRRLPGNLKARIQKAIEERLAVDPVKYGDPLRRSLRGFRKLRVGDYRVIYEIDSPDVVILKIGHRKEVYSKVEKRLE